MSDLLALLELNTRQLLRLSADTRLDDAIETQHVHATIDLVCSDDPVESLAVQLLLHPLVFEVGVRS